MSGWCQERQEKGQGDFMPLYLQRVLVISCVFRNADGLRVHSFVDRDNASEGKVIQTFFNALEKHVPQLVSWNGGGFDLPVLHYRGLQHGVVADKYWCMGEEGGGDAREFKWNNYISRYHMRHLDLMDLLAMYQPKNNAPLDAMAKLCGFPGKLGMDGSQVYPAFLRRQARGHPALLRNRRDEHLPAVLPLPEDARRPDRGRVRAGDRDGQGDAGQPRAAGAALAASTWPPGADRAA